MRKPVDIGPPPPREGPIRAAFLPAEDIDVVIDPDGNQVVIRSRDGIERVRLSPVGALLLARLITARGLE